MRGRITREIVNGPHFIRVKTLCRMCKQTKQVRLPEGEWVRWRHGDLIQQAISGPGAARTADLTLTNLRKLFR